MNRKTKANTTKSKTPSTEPVNAGGENTTSPEAATVAVVEIEEKVDHFNNIVLKGKGRKLSPKTDNDVFFELALHDEEEALYLRLSGNEGGGLHSKEWLTLQSILSLLKDNADKPFKSTMVKPLFSGASANNAGFLCAALRGIGLLTQSGSSVFLHQLSGEFETRCNELLAMDKVNTDAQP